MSGERPTIRDSHTSGASVALPDYPRARDLGGDVWALDTLHHGHPGTIAVFLLRLPRGGYALVESGPAVSQPEVEAAMAAAGASLAELRFVLLTHIHLDHAGAAGAIARESGAQVVVHRIGARHMVDPSRLMASATRVYGDALEHLWGIMEPVAEERVRAVEGEERLDLDGLGVRVLYTPGHASHHVGYLLDDGTLFAGDAAGVRLQGASVVRPALPPPDLDLEAAERSLKAMRALRPDRLILTHFGPVVDPVAHLEAVPEANRRWEREFAAGFEAGEDDEALVARIEALEDAELRQAGVPSGIAARYKITSDAAMTVGGLKRYLTKKAERDAADSDSRSEPSFTPFPLGRTARIAVLASGRGSNLASLIEAFPPHKGGGDPLATVVLAVTDKSGAPALAKATAAGVTAAYIPWQDRPTFEARLHDLLELHEVDLVCLAGFMRILSADFTKAYAGRLLNIHPSLLPAFRGLEPQRQALEAGVQETGCSVHFVDEGVDTGPVVMQAKVPVQPGDTVETLSARILEAEHRLYPAAVRAVLAGEGGRDDRGAAGSSAGAAQGRPA